MWNILFSLITAFLITAILGPVAIPVLKHIKFGQSIRAEGPKWHQVKSGTPTMGGLVFIAGILAATLVFEFSNPTVLLMLLAAAGFGIIGFLDDYIKVVQKRNLGLLAWQKFLLQLIVSVIYVVVLVNAGIIDSGVIIPFIGMAVDFSWFYMPFAVFVILATVNSVNLTDGVDGLASSVTFVVSVFLTVAAFIQGEYDIALFSSAVTGGCLGFLLYNAHPAKMFMGDVGALFLGGCISVIAIALKLPLILIIVGGVYLVETLSVIMQVISFKLTKKRIFKMTPIHHHFEMCGYSENKIVFLFSFATLILALISFFGVV